MTTQEREKVETERHGAMLYGFMLGIGLGVLWCWVIAG